MRGRSAVVLLGLIMLVSGGPPVAAAPPEGDVVATGHIVVGLGLPEEFAYTFLSDQLQPPGESVHAFRFPVHDLAGVWLLPVVVDQQHPAHYLDMTFRAADNEPIPTECLDAAGSHALVQQPYGGLSVTEQCRVPDGAVEGRVTAHLGANLDVIVVVATGPQPVHPDPDVILVTNFGAGHGAFIDAMYAFFGAEPGGDDTTTHVGHLTGKRLVIETEDHSGMGYDLRLAFRAVDGRAVAASCAWDDSSTGPLEAPHGSYRQKQTCIVPDDAERVRLVPYHALDVDALVRVVSA